MSFVVRSNAGIAFSVQETRLWVETYKSKRTQLIWIFGTMRRRRGGGRPHGQTGGMSSQELTLILYMVASRLLIACLASEEPGACLGVHSAQQKQPDSGQSRWRAHHGGEDAVNATVRLGQPST